MSLTKRNNPHTAHLLIDGARIPVFIFTERRRDCRVSVGKTGIRIRLASGMLQEERDKQVRELINWAESKVREKGWSHAEPHRRYTNGELIRLADVEHRVVVEQTARQRVSATLEDNLLLLRLPAGISASDRDEALSETVSRVCRRHYGEWIRERVHELNALHFGFPLGQIRIKHNRSNWGSCSVSGNINLNVRLLLAPVAVLDYVVVHELAHLKQHNHSAAYWRLVAKAMPDYQRYVDWLRVHGAECIF
jgi:predicted metal-dependent hydrolase